MACDVGHLFIGSFAISVSPSARCVYCGLLLIFFLKKVVIVLIVDSSGLVSFGAGKTAWQLEHMQKSTAWLPALPLCNSSPGSPDALCWPPWAPAGHMHIFLHCRHKRKFIQFRIKSGSGGARL